MKRKGVTIVELMVAMFVLVAVFALGNILMNYTNKAMGISNRESVIQANLRVACETISNTVKNSTAMFLIPDSSFSNGGLTEEWDYIGVVNRVKDGKNVSQVIHFVYDKTAMVHKETVLSESSDGIIYSLEFIKKDMFSKEKLVQFNLYGYYGDDSTGYDMKVEAEIEALNSLQVIDYSTDIDVATAIAFRSDERDTTQVVGQVALVLDCSGSMNFGMTTAVVEPDLLKTRSYALRKAGQVLLDKLIEAGDSTKLSLVTFSYYAAVKYPDSFPIADRAMTRFLKFSDYYDEIYDMFDIRHYTKYSSGSSSSITDNSDPLDPIGATNTGDGLRLAYYSMVEENNKTIAEGNIPANYMILMIDGEVSGLTHDNSTTGKPLNSSYVPGDLDYDLYYGDKAYGASNIGYMNTYMYVYSTGNVRVDDESFELCEEYLEGVANIIRANPDIRVFFVVLSEVDQGAIDKLSSDLGVRSGDMFKTSDMDELGEIFENIGKAIVSDLWFINGPQL